MRTFHFLVIAILLALFQWGLAGCAPGETEEVPPTPTAIPATPTTVDPLPSPTYPVPQPTPQPPPIPTEVVNISPVCSPLHGFQIIQLEEIISNPFEMPNPGSDDGHHGVDFAFFRYGIFDKMEGLPVQSMLNGLVAGAFYSRRPYGNTLIIETPLDELPNHWATSIDPLLKTPQIASHIKLFCPEPIFFEPTTHNGLSLYLLYAHLEKPPTLTIGNRVDCGQQIGFVGTSGSSVNPHLHVEARVGPSGTQFDQMAHYISDASELEMQNYCVWRVSGLFALKDPMELIEISE